MQSSKSACLPLQLRGDSLSEMQRLHFDLVRQLHQQNMEAQGMVEAVMQRQDGIEDRLLQLDSKVNRLLRIRQEMLL